MTAGSLCVFEISCCVTSGGCVCLCLFECCVIAGVWCVFVFICIVLQLWVGVYTCLFVCCVISGAVFVFAFVFLCILCDCCWVCVCLCVV
jgi:hypothetical protein